MTTRATSHHHNNATSNKRTSNKTSPSRRTVQRPKQNPVSKKKSNPFSNSQTRQPRSVYNYQQYTARQGNSVTRSSNNKSRYNTSRSGSRVRNAGIFSSIKNVGEKIKDGVLKFANKNTYIGAIAALGKHINSLNYRQGTRLGSGTCGLCSMANIAKAIKMARALKNGSKGLFKSVLGVSNKALEYAMIRKARHVGGGGTTHPQQIANMKNMSRLIGKQLGLSKSIYGGARFGSRSLLNKILAQGRLAQINIASRGLFGGGNMVRGGIDHAVSVLGMRVTKSGQTQYALVDSSGARAGRGMQWIDSNRLAGRNFEMTYTKPLTELI